MTREEGNFLLAQLNAIVDRVPTGKDAASILINLATGIAAIGGIIVGMIDREDVDGKKEVVQ